MNLSVYNFGKIKSAEIDLKGLTVIAGLNDTGKSTIGKILYGIFNSVKNIDRAITKAKKRALQKAIWESLLNDSEGFIRYRLERSIYSFADDWYSVKENKVDFDALFEYLKKKESNYKFVLSENIKTRIQKSVNDILSISNEQFSKSIVTEQFRDIFNGQINDVRKNDLDAQIHLKIKQKNLDFTFRKNELESFNKEISLINTATYIENPSVLDSLNDSIYGSSLLENLTEKINNTYYDDDDDEDVVSESVEDRVLSKQLALKKIEQITAELNGIVPGNIDYSDGEYVYKEEGGQPLNVSSLSTGFKSFALVKQLLLNQQLRERDVLILDEPEVHLHPAWQLKYAEIIVLLQKICNLTVVVTTHSSHFLEALDLYSKIHKTNGYCSYYFASLDQSQRSVFENIAGNLDVIYRSLVEPNFLIDKIKEEKGIE